MQLLGSAGCFPKAPSLGCLTCDHVGDGPLGLLGVTRADVAQSVFGGVQQFFVFSFASNPREAVLE